MLDRRSALASFPPVASDAVSLGEARGFTLTQAAGFSTDIEAAISAVTGPLPSTTDKSIESNGRVIFRTAPLQFWLVGPEQDDLARQLVDKCIVTSLSHSRTRIFIDGYRARDVLAKGIGIDLHPSEFTSGTFAMTGLHHTPILLHCVSQHRFELYAMRTFAANIWEWLTDAALEFTAS